MFEYIKYCLLCAGYVISMSFGYVYDNVTWEMSFTGIATIFVLICIFVLIVFLIKYYCAWLNKRKDWTGVKKELVDYLIKLLNGDISPKGLMAYFELNPKSLICFNKYARGKLYSTFDNVNEIKSKLSKKNIRIYVYQLVQEFLDISKIHYTVGAEEYVLYNEMCNQCPKWFQKDFDLLYSLFTNLEELIKNNELNEKITSICKTTNGIYPEWLQGAEWPVINGVVCIFDSQTILPDDMNYGVDSISYSFINPITNERINVVQYD